MHVRLLDRVEGVPCAGLDLGVIGAAGTPSTANGRAGESHSLWVDVFASLRLQVRMFRPIFVIGEGELALPLTRPRFSFDPNTPVYAVPAVAGALSLACSCSFRDRSARPGDNPVMTAVGSGAGLDEVGRTKAAPLLKPLCDECPGCANMCRIALEILAKFP